jgi:hypothetical protein
MAVKRFFDTFLKVCNARCPKAYYSKQINKPYFESDRDNCVPIQTWNYLMYIVTCWEIGLALSSQETIEILKLLSVQRRKF